jgi:hypothetical protein
MYFRSLNNVMAKYAANMGLRSKALIMTAFTIIFIILLFFLPPIAQDPTYHCFADNSTIWGIPNFWNVISNAPFLIIGITGLFLPVQKREQPIQIMLPAILFFIGVIGIGLGSSYYHLMPTNTTLIWDRMPMTIAFMSFLAFIISDRINRKTGILLLLPLILTGIASVLYWYFMELKGSGDLRPYILVQFYPMLAIPLITFLYPAKNPLAKKIFLVIIFYAIAKFFELTDYHIYKIGELISGHTLKHLAAAVAVWQILNIVKYK